MNEFVGYSTLLVVWGMTLQALLHPTPQPSWRREGLITTLLSAMLLAQHPNHPTLLLHPSMMLLATGWWMGLLALLLTPWTHSNHLQAPSHVVATLGLTGLLWQPLPELPIASATPSEGLHALLAVISTGALALTLLQALATLTQHMALKRSRPWGGLPSLGRLQSDLHVWLWLSFSTLTLAILLGMWLPEHTWRMHKAGFAVAVWALLGMVLFRFAHWRFESRRLMQLLAFASILLLITYSITWGES